MRNDNETCRATNRPPRQLTGQQVIWGYRHGLFPMADCDSSRIMWFSPDPRAIIDLDTFHVPRTLNQTIRRGAFHVTANQCFAQVIRCCAQRHQTWISPEIIDVYCELHDADLAHSLETWQDDRLVGGLYGVALGAAFFGESMFSRETDASKFALVALVQQLRRQEFELLDIQYLTDHLARFAARTIPRSDYLRRLAHALARQRQFVDKDAPRITIVSR